MSTQWVHCTAMQLGRIVDKGALKRVSQLFAIEPFFGWPSDLFWTNSLVWPALHCCKLFQSGWVCELSYKGFPTYKVSKNTVFSLCSWKWRILASVESLEQSHLGEFCVTWFFSNPKIRVMRGHSEGVLGSLVSSLLDIALACWGSMAIVNL